MTPTATQRLARAYVRGVLRWGPLLWVLALVLAVPATWRTADMYAHLRSEVEMLLPEDAPSFHAVLELRRRFAGLQFLAVVAEVPDAAQLPDAERFLDALDARVATYPQGLVVRSRKGMMDEAAFFRSEAALYVEAADLAELRRRVEAQRDREVARASGSLLDDDEPAPLDLADLRVKYKDALAAARPTGERNLRFSSVKEKASVLVLEASSSTAVEDARDLLDRVRADVAALSPTLPEVRVGYAADLAIRVEEFDALTQDLSIASVLVVLAVGGIVALYFGRLSSLLVLTAPLALATVYAFALASLPPFRVRELNANTAFLASIIVGNGINFGIVLLSRYDEERAAGQDLASSLAEAVVGASRGTLAATFAAAIAYGSLLATEFRGFRQFGLIGIYGMLFSWLTAFTLAPWLVARLASRRKDAVVAREGFAPLGRLLLRIVETAPRAVIAVAVLVTMASLATLPRLSKDHIESDMAKLRRADTWIHGEGYWGRKLERVLGTYLTPTVYLTDSEEQARRLASAVRAASGPGSRLAPFVASVRSLDDVMPRDQSVRAEEAARLAEVLTPAVRGALKPEEREVADALAAGAPKPVRLADVPPSLLAGLVEGDGSAGKSVLVFPKPNPALWTADGIEGFTAELRRIAEGVTLPNERSPRLAGSLPVSADLLSAIEGDSPIAMALAFVGVVVTILVAMRGRREGLFVLGSLLLGVLWLVGISLGLGVKVNFANFIAFPITLGIGADYAVNVMSRYLQDRRETVRTAVLATGGAVVLCSATTILGYGSLLGAKNRALFSFGVLAVAGEVTCLVAAVLVLPALLVLLERRRARLLAGAGPATTAPGPAGSEVP